MRNPRIQQIQLSSTWSAFTYRIAVIGSSATALVSLVVGASVSTSCLRGGGVWLVLLLIGASSRWLLDRSFPELEENQTSYEFDPRDLV
ncbi:MAG: uncharacterized membrane protein YraQ (UPF0718 family) [Planctomycetota bacterium]|jgi:uncharacterized membrane protein YraQ (UPF0718 family)